MDIETLTINVSAEPSRGSRGLARALDWLMTGSLYALVLLMPLWFMPSTLDVLELNKQTLLIILAMLGLIGWLGKSLVERSFTFSRSWMHLMVLLFALGALAASWFSVDKYLSFAGNIGQMPWAFATILACVVVYFLLVHAVRSTARLYHLVVAFLVSGLMAALYGLLQLSKVFSLGWISSVTASNAFNSVGTPDALASYLAIVVVTAASLLVLGCREQGCILNRRGAPSMTAKAVVWAALVLGLAVLVVVDFWPAWAAVLVGTLITSIIAYARTREVGSPTKIAVPVVVCLVAIVLLIWQTPIKLGVPAEVLPSMAHSWALDQAVLKDHPLLGFGPGSFLYVYSMYRQPVVNLTPYWTIRFDNGFSAFFTLLATLGLIGMALWLMLILSALSKSLLHVFKEPNDVQWQAYLTVFSAWAALVFLSFVANFGMAHLFIFWLFLGLLVALLARDSMSWSSTDSSNAMMGISVVFALLCVASVCALWLTGQRLAADIQYSRAVAAYNAKQPIQMSIDDLNSAVALNPMNDVYQRNLSQAYLVELNQVFTAHPTADQSKQMSDLVTSSLAAANQATSLNPSNVDNWSNLASIDEAIASFTPGADQQAIANYQTALTHEPTNPIFYNEIGKLYIERADAYATLLTGKDASTTAQAQANMQQQLSSAEAALNQSVALKGDYAPAHYNLGILYERQGKLPQAILKFEQVLASDNKDVGVAFQLAILYGRNNQIDKAQNLFEQIVAIDPSYVNARWYLAAIYASKGRYDDAIAQLTQIAQLDPQNAATANAQLQAVQQAKAAAAAKPATPPAATSSTLPLPLNNSINSPAPLNPVKTH